MRLEVVDCAWVRFLFYFYFLFLYWLIDDWFKGILTQALEFFWDFIQEEMSLHKVDHTVLWS